MFDSMSLEAVKQTGETRVRTKQRKKENDINFKVHLLFRAEMLRYMAIYFSCSLGWCSRSVSLVYCLPLIHIYNRT